MEPRLYRLQFRKSQKAYSYDGAKNACYWTLKKSPQLSCPYCRQMLIDLQRFLPANSKDTSKNRATRWSCCCNSW